MTTKIPVRPYRTVAESLESPDAPQTTAERKIVQIAFAVTPSDVEIVSALCNDKTVWTWSPDHEGKAWFQLPPIPQPGGVV